LGHLALKYPKCLRMYFYLVERASSEYFQLVLNIQLFSLIVNLTHQFFVQRQDQPAVLLLLPLLLLLLLEESVHYGNQIRQSLP
jgi:hypothetical protein